MKILFTAVFMAISISAHAQEFEIVDVTGFGSVSNCVVVREYSRALEAYKSGKISAELLKLIEEISLGSDVDPTAIWASLPTRWPKKP